jgi:pyridoxine kinase
VILILSSLVAASAVGGSAQAAALERQGVQAMLIPTVLYGRHPGLGAPGGGSVPQDLFGGVIAGVAASGALAKVEAVIAGYFASAEQVAAAARLIDQARQANAAVRIIVDPIMGDEGVGLYVSEATAAAMAGALVPRADLVCPNAWELGRLTGQEVTDVASALAAAHALGRPALVSSVAERGDIANLLTGEEGAFLATHARAPGAPRGCGDRLTAAFTAAWLSGAMAQAALTAATRAVADAVLGAGAAVEVRRLG